MVVLDQCGIGQRHPVIDATAHPDRVLLHHAQAGYGLAGVPHLVRGSGERPDPGPGRRRDPRHQGQQVEGDPFGPQQRAGVAGHGHQHVAAATAAPSRTWISISKAPAGAQTTATTYAATGMPATAARLPGDELAASHVVGRNGGDRGHVHARRPNRAAAHHVRRDPRPGPRRRSRPAPSRSRPVSSTSSSISGQAGVAHRRPPPRPARSCAAGRDRDRVRRSGGRASCPAGPRSRRANGRRATPRGAGPRRRPRWPPSSGWWPPRTPRPGSHAVALGELGQLGRTPVEPGRPSANHRRAGSSTAASPGPPPVDQPGSALVGGRRPARRQGAVQLCGDPLGEHQPLEQRVGGQPVGAVDAGGRHLAAGVEADQVGGAVEIGLDAATEVVAGRGDRDQVRDRVRSRPGGSCAGWSGTGPARSPRPASGRRRRRGRSPPCAISFMIPLATTSRGASSASSCWPTMNRSPRELTSWPPSPRTASLTSGSWPRAPGPEEQHGRVELDELDVAQPGAGPQRGGDPVAGGDRRIGRHRVDLPDAAGRQDHGPRVDRADAPAGALTEHVQGDTGDGGRLAGGRPRPESGRGPARARRSRSPGRR